jgi:hypothetical protein
LFLFFFLWLFINYYNYYLFVHVMYQNMEHRAEYVYLWWLSFVFIKGFFNREECIKIVLIYPYIITALFTLHLSFDCANFTHTLYSISGKCLPFHHHCSIVAISIILVSYKYVLFYLDEWFHFKHSRRMICTLHQILLGWSKEDEISKTCSLHVWNEKCVQHYSQQA